MGTQQMIYAVTASVIGGLVLLTMFWVQRRGQEASIDAVQYRSAKSSVLSLVEIMERDFQNMGAHMYWNGTTFIGVTEDPAAVIENTWYDSTAVPGGMRYMFQFRSQPDSLQAPALIRYEWEPIDGESVTLENGTVRPLFEIRRFAGGTLSYSERTITEFDLEILPDTVAHPLLVNMEDARIFKVELQAISPLGKGDTVEETRFAATYRPTAMTITDNLN
jgi:hypothetical protein